MARPLPGEALAQERPGAASAQASLALVRARRQAPLALSAERLVRRPGYAFRTFKT